MNTRIKALAQMSERELEELLDCDEISPSLAKRIENELVHRQEHAREKTHKENNDETPE